MPSVGVVQKALSRPRFLSLLVVLPLLAWSAPTDGAPVAEPGGIYTEDTAIVAYRTHMVQAMDAWANALGAELMWDNPELGIAVVRVADPARFVAEAAERPEVRYAERDPLIFPEHEPNDISYSSQWGMPAIRAPEAWDVAFGAGVTVAVLDTGVEYYHPDLALSMWTNLDEIPGNNADDDGNGYVDDVIGWDFSGNDNNPMSETCGAHGTHVAGIVAATQDNVLGVTGVAPHAKVMALRMLCGGGPSLSLAMQAVHYAAMNGARIVTCSWHSGGATSAAFEATVTWAYNMHDMLFVKSAGNQYGGGVTYPGTLPEYIAVSSISSNMQLSSFSSVGSKVELAAPGDGIYSTYSPAPFSSLSGTSMAAPHVAGVAALAWSSDPTLTRDDVRSRLAATALDLGAPGRDNQYGFGLVNAAGAVGSP